MDPLLIGLRALAGGVAVCYVAFLLFRASRPAVSLSNPAVRDMRIVLDLAARLREAGRPEAVRLCQQLLDELLKTEPKA